MKKSLLQRLLDGYSVSDTGCWIWNGAKDPKGYGRLYANGRNEVASRAAYQTFVGPIPDDRLVCHKCDTPACINPKHLFIGTYSDNAQDMHRKGRNPSRRGESNGNNVLTEDAVRAIRSSKETCIALGKKYGVDNSIISQVKRRRLWKHVA